MRSAHRCLVRIHPQLWSMCDCGSEACGMQFAIEENLQTTLSEWDSQEALHTGTLEIFHTTPYGNTNYSLVIHGQLYHLTTLV